jgi:hypothetical protein
MKGRSRVFSEGPASGSPLLVLKGKKGEEGGREEEKRNTGKMGKGRRIEGKGKDDARKRRR